MFPRVVTYERGPEYMPKEGQESWIPLGYIPQVLKTCSKTLVVIGFNARTRLNSACRFPLGLDE